MISARQLAANRRNAARSTGPRSQAGKVRSSRNALKHGLAISLLSDAKMAQEVSTLAAAIAGEARADPSVLALAGVIAEAELDLIRIRMARVQLLSALAADPATFTPKLPKRLRPQLIERAFSLPLSDHPLYAMAQEAVRKLVTPVESGPEKEALVLAHAAAQLLRLDRYERRAMSRRKAAIRAFDTA